MGPRVSARGARRVTSSGSCSVGVSNGRRKAHRNRGNCNRGGNRSTGKRRGRNQRRAAAFRKQHEVSRQLRLVDEYGNEQFIREYGRLGITKHTGVMSALEKRSLRFRRGAYSREDARDKALYEDALDETGTVNTEAFTDSDNESGGGDTIQQRNKFEAISGVPDELLRVHGVAPGVKPEGCSRFVYENSDGIRNHINGNDKLDKGKELFDELGADIVAINEHQLNLQHKKNKNGLSQMFNGGGTDIRTVAGHNVHENVGRVQQGGTGLLLYGPLCQQLQFDESGAEDTGMGRWVVMTLQGEDGFVTRLVSAYNPCYNNKKESGTAYQQQRRALITKFKDTTCPRTRFRLDLEKQLRTWREAGDRIIVAMDANEDIYKKKIGCMLTDRSGLAMKEVVGSFTGKKIGATFFRGSKPIDGVWATSDVDVVSACVMPVGYGIGDHRMFVIDFLTASLIGTNPTRVVRPGARRLHTKLARGVDKYIQLLESGIIHHRLVERIQEVYEGNYSKWQAEDKLNKIDQQRKELMIHAEKKCRRISSGRIPFSEESSLWIRRLQVYRSLLKYHAGKVTNRGNLKRAARRCKIFKPMQLKVAEIRDRLKEAKEKCRYFRRHGKRYRSKHLQRCYERAQARKDEEAARKILAIIEREKQRRFWRAQNMAMGKKKGRGVSVVQTQDDEGRVTEHHTQKAITDAIFENIHNKRFYRAESAPICQGQMREDFGYMAMSDTAKAILAGSYQYPDYFDQSTRELCEECARFRLRIKANSVNSDIETGRWQQRWARVKEDTSSSESGLHFSHYKAGAESELISGLHAIFTTVALRRGFSPERWSRGLSVMLEKMFGCSLVSKLRSILLMEADFNFSNKEIFGNRMMENVRKHNFMCDEIYSEKGRMADDGGLAKTLFYDIVRQTRLPAAISSVDAAQCYDSIAHAIASLVFQSFGVPDGAIESMLGAIQDMKYFLRTAFGDSKEYTGSTIQVKFQGLCQGNGAAPAGFAVISITILHAHKRKGHGTVIKCPISNTDGHLAAILFVDDCDLLHLRMDKKETVQEAHQAMQDSMTNWGKLLIATGGSLKPEKCFAYIISFEWDKNGKWKYQANEEYEEADVTVPLPDGTSQVIDNLPVDECRETLGMVTCPAGANHGAIEKMQEKAQEWVDRAKNGKMQRRSMWFMSDVQFWPSVKYGLCANTASLAELAECLQTQYRQMLPLGGIVRTCYVPIRQLDRGFYGAGCPHPGIECLVEQSEKLLTHYGCRTSLGLKLQCSLDLFIVELGISTNPLNESYSRYASWVTHSWFKSLWEKISKFKISVETNNIPLQPPRVGDKWIMRVFQEAGFNKSELERLNRVRIHQQVLFLSCVLGAGGKIVDKKYLQKRPENEQWSTILFPQEQPPRKDFALWKRAILQICPAGRINDRLGVWKSKGIKIWPWRLDLEGSRLLHQTGPNTMDIYQRSLIQRYSRFPNRYTRTYTHQPLEITGEICTVEEVGPATVKMISHSAPEQPPEPPQDFREVLDEWGFGWMWSDLKLQGDDNWIECAIEDNSLVAVTDGSFIRELYPNLCSAAFILVCTKGRGRLVGSFSETSQSACAYRGELLGVMAVHLILLSVNKVNKVLQGTATLFCDCLGALNKVKNLPTDRISSRSKHSDVLKNIMVNCSNLSFTINYQHVEAHQDDHEQFHNLPLEGQLNCGVDYGAKKRIWDADPLDLPSQEPFPLEPICMMVDREKVTSDTGQALRFHAHRQSALGIFHSKKILDKAQFEEVEWRYVHAALNEVPRMFQVWACKQVHDIAATNKNLLRRGKTSCDKCPSCGTAVEDAKHVLYCRDAGRVEALKMTVDLMREWMVEKGTDSILVEMITEFARGRDSVTMEELAWGKPELYRRFARSQDKIGWRRFMEGMISKEISLIQNRYLINSGSSLSIRKWMIGLVIRLLEITHGQWLYRNVQVHDDVSGVNATLRKEELMREIEKQLELGTEGLPQEDRYLLEINLEDLETTSGEKQTYWLLAIRAARRAHRLTRRCNRDERTTVTISEDEEQSLALSEDEEQSQGSIEVPQNEVVEILEIHPPPRVRRISEGWNLDDEDDDELDNTFVQDPPPRVRRVVAATGNHESQRRV